MKARILNNQWAGNFPLKWLDDNASKIIGGQLVSEWQLVDLLPSEIEKLYNQLMWDGTAYYEGVTSEELEQLQIQKISEYRLKIYDYTERLFNSSQARVLNKFGQGLTKFQLDALEIFYLKKNDVANEYINNQTITNQAIFELIQFEEENDFAGVKLDNEVAYLNTEYSAQIPTTETRLKQYCYLISVKFNLGKQLDEALKSLCEIFRSKLITNLDNLEFEKIDQRIELIQSITNETTIAQILALKTPFDAI